MSIRTAGNGLISPARSTVARAVLGCVVLMFTSLTHAQVGLIGYWDPIFDEDVDERIPGPPIGDYLGLPINDAAR